MARLNILFTDYTYISLSIEGLENPIGDYDEFLFKNNTTGVTTLETWNSTIFFNLNEGTQYTFSAKAKYAGTWYDCGTVTATTLYHTPPPVPAYAPILTGRVEGGLSLQWGASDGSTTYLSYKNYTGIYTEYSMLNTYYTLKGLEYGVTYYFKVRAKNTWGLYSDYTNESTATTAPKTPSISVAGSSGNTVYIGISGLIGNYDYVTIFCYDNNWNVVSTQNGQNGSSVAFSGLAQGTYYFQAWSYYYVNGTTLQSVNYSQVSVTLNTRPQNWSWSYNIQSGGSVYSTVVSGSTIYAYIVPASEWNSFCSRINEFRIYKGLGNYSFTSVSSGSDCTPAIINEAVSAINGLGFSISNISAGNVPASVFINMRDSLNSIT